MPLVCFNANTFKGEPVDCSQAARRRADFNCKLSNLQKMGLTDEEIADVCRRDYFHALCAENRAKVKAP